MPTPVSTSREFVIPLGADAALRRKYLVYDRAMPGNVRFGLLLEHLDKLAEETALDYVRAAAPDARVVTAAIDNIYIRKAADVGRDIMMRARVNWTGRTSLEVGIRVEHSPAPQDHIASCYFTMVARSGAGAEARSLPVPALEYADALAARRRDKALAHRAAQRAAQDAADGPPTADEHAALRALHEAQEAPGFAGRRAADCVVSTWERMYPEYENVPEKIFGGYLIRRAYECASLCAELPARRRPVIVAVNRINFLQPVRLGDKLRFTSRAVYAGNHSVQVETGITRISRERDESALSNSCIFTFVNVDDGLALQPVEAVHPVTYAEDARWLAAHRRRLAHREWRATRRRD